MTAPNFLLGLVSLPLKLMNQSTSIYKIKNACVCTYIYIYSYILYLYLYPMYGSCHTSMDPKGSLTTQFPGLSQDPYLQVKVITQGWWRNPVCRQSHEKRWMSRCRIQLNRLKNTFPNSHRAVSAAFQQSPGWLRRSNILTAREVLTLTSRIKALRTL